MSAGGVCMRGKNVTEATQEKREKKRSEVT